MALADELRAFLNVKEIAVRAVLDKVDKESDDPYHNKLCRRMLCNSTLTRISEARQWLGEISADDAYTPNYIKALWIVGILMCNSLDIQATNKSMFCMKMAADQGHAGACYRLASYYMHGGTQEAQMVDRCEENKSLEKALEYAGKSRKTDEFDTAYYRQKHWRFNLKILKRVIEKLLTSNDAQI